MLTTAHVQARMANGALKHQATNEVANRRLSVFGLTVGQPVRFPANSKSTRRTRTGHVVDVESDGSIRVVDDKRHAVHSIPPDRITTTRSAT